MRRTIEARDHARGTNALTEPQIWTEILVQEAGLRVKA